MVVDLRPPTGHQAETGMSLWLGHDVINIPLIGSSSSCRHLLCGYSAAQVGESDHRQPSVGKLAGVTPAVVVPRHRRSLHVHLPSGKGVLL